MHRSWLGGGISNLGPLILLLLGALDRDHGALLGSLHSVGFVLASVGVSAGGLLLTRFPGIGRWLTTASILAVLALVATPLMLLPGRMLALLLSSGAVLYLVWERPAPQRDPHRRLETASPRARMRAAAAMALACWFLVAVAQVSEGVEGLVAVAASMGITIGLAIPWVVDRWSHWSWKDRAWLLVPLAAVVAIVLSWEAPYPVTLWMGLPSAACLLVAGERSLAGESTSLWDGVMVHPARLLVVTFVGLSALGSILLALPVSTASDAGIRWVDAVFTSVSAVCVTGLIVLDTPRDFTALGQLWILILIQLGGLGIMSFSTAALGILGRRISLRHEGALAGLISGRDRGQLFIALRRLLVVTFVAEGLGAISLTLLFWWSGDRLLMGVWRGIFTAISAFCNAGFALQTTSLVAYQSNPWILHVVALLIVMGGLSPAVVTAIPAIVRGRAVSVHVKLVVVMTVVLLLVGTLAIAAFEWTGTLGEMSFWDRWHNAWFQSVTLRTAGFNSIDISGVGAATLSLMMVLMFIGGSPGSTAGGIKTTTAGILLLAVRGAIRGSGEAIAFGRLVSQRTVYHAAAIATIGAFFGLIALVALQLTQTMSNEKALFEVVSALGTVGLSVGGTAALDDIGKVVIILSMFAGRVGPLTLFIFLVERRTPSAWQRPEVDIEVG